jgi:hypothetical protein
MMAGAQIQNRGRREANRRYAAFGRKADAEGFPQIAALFRAVAEPEDRQLHCRLAEGPVGGGSPSSAAWTLSRGGMLDISLVRRSSTSGR